MHPKEKREKGCIYKTLLVIYKNPTIVGLTQDNGFGSA
jgi:hypothetical protein